MTTTTTHGADDAAFLAQVVECHNGMRLTIGELRAAFDRIAPAGNWKLPIRARIEAAEFPLMDAAAVFMTGAGIARVGLEPGPWLVVGKGYYAATGA
jgi:hypothetical protein